MASSTLDKMEKESYSPEAPDAIVVTPSGSLPSCYDIILKIFVIYITPIYFWGAVVFLGSLSPIIGWIYAARRGWIYGLAGASFFTTPIRIERNIRKACLNAEPDTWEYIKNDCNRFFIDRAVFAFLVFCCFVPFLFLLRFRFYSWRSSYNKERNGDNFVKNYFCWLYAPTSTIREGCWIRHNKVTGRREFIGRWAAIMSCIAGIPAIIITRNTGIPGMALIFNILVLLIGPFTVPLSISLLIKDIRRLRRNIKNWGGCFACCHDCRTDFRSMQSDPQLIRQEIGGCICSGSRYAKEDPVALAFTTEETI